MSAGKLVAPAVIAAVLMGFTSWFGDWAQPRTLMAEQHPRAPLAAVLPDQIGDWRVDRSQATISLPPDVAAQVAKIYTEVIDRVYVNGRGDRVMLTIAYGKDQSDGFKVHRPEVCYAAQGFTVASPIGSMAHVGGLEIPVMQVETHLNSRYEPVMYWMVIGDQVVNTPMKHKFAQIRYAFDGLVADGLLVRISSIDRDPQNAYRVQENFLRDWYTKIPDEQRSRFFGRG